MKNKIMLWTLCLVALAVTAACSNTAEGFGRDMEKAGQSIQKTF